MCAYKMNKMIAPLEMWPISSMDLVNMLDKVESVNLSVKKPSSFEVQQELKKSEGWMAEWTLSLTQ